MVKSIFIYLFYCIEQLNLQLYLLSFHNLPTTEANRLCNNEFVKLLNDLVQTFLKNKASEPVFFGLAGGACNCGVTVCTVNLAGLVTSDVAAKLVASLVPGRGEMLTCADVELGMTTAWATLMLPFMI